MVPEDPKLKPQMSQLPFADTWATRVHATQLSDSQSSALPPTGDLPVCELSGDKIKVIY